MNATPPARNETATDNFLRALDEVECIICEEAFGATHAPVLLPKFHHILGRHCLKAWVQSPNCGNNRCPNCRVILFDDGLPLVRSDEAEMVITEAVRARHLQSHLYTPCSISCVIGVTRRLPPNRINYPLAMSPTRAM
jgi:hypothetical protein